MAKATKKKTSRKASRTSGGRASKKVSARRKASSSSRKTSAQSTQPKKKLARGNSTKKAKTSTRSKKAKTPAATRSSKKTPRTTSSRKRNAKTRSKTAARKPSLETRGIEQVLLAKRKELDARILERIMEQQSSITRRSADTTDMAADSMDEELALLVAEAETHERAQIDEALEKVRAGTYGLCERCGKQIPAARLKALPFAALCVECKTLEEEYGPEYFEETDEE